MKERPILFKAPMVRAILEGRKTQTRRVIADCHLLGGPPTEALLKMCPYGQPGDRLWVRETIYAWGRWETRFSKKKGRDEWHFIDMTLESGKQYRYPATMTGDNGPRQRGSVTPLWWKRPSIHAPRWASRILLDITAVRVERLHDIRNEDCIAEGIEVHQNHEVPRTGLAINDFFRKNSLISHYGAEYRMLWESINGKGSWESNPWVWAIKFKQVRP